MNVKIDTKEKFTVITPDEAILAANMTAELSNLLLPYLQKGIPHIVLNMESVKLIDDNTGDLLATVQQQFYENNCSFVICELQQAVERMRGEVRKVIVGQEHLVDLLLIALLSDGHVLIEGAPGLAKTLLVKSIAQIFHLRFQRIQFTPDLMPADITGTDILVDGPYLRELPDTSRRWRPTTWTDCARSWVTCSCRWCSTPGSARRRRTRSCRGRAYSRTGGWTTAPGPCCSKRISA